MATHIVLYSTCDIWKSLIQYIGMESYDNPDVKLNATEYVSYDNNIIKCSQKTKQRLDKKNQNIVMYELDEGTTKIIYEDHEITATIEFMTPVIMVKYSIDHIYKKCTLASDYGIDHINRFLLHLGLPQQSNKIEYLYL